MLKYKSSGNQLSRQPDNGLPDQVTCKIEKTLAHPDIKRPGRESLAPNIVREMDKIRIRIVYRVGSDIFVQEYLIAQQEVVKYQDSYEQQNQCNQKRNEKTSKGKKDTNGRSRVRPAWRIANVLIAHLEQKNNPSLILATIDHWFCSSR